MMRPSGELFAEHSSRSTSRVDARTASRASPIKGFAINQLLEYWMVLSRALKHAQETRLL